MNVWQDTKGDRGDWKVTLRKVPGTKGPYCKLRINSRNAIRTQINPKPGIRNHHSGTLRDRVFVVLGTPDLHPTQPQQVSRKLFWQVLSVTNSPSRDFGGLENTNLRKNRPLLVVTSFQNADNTVTKVYATRTVGHERVNFTRLFVH